jgi:DNA repair exonuclease SbcCD ATPase subunit
MNLDEHKTNSIVKTTERDGLLKELQVLKAKIQEGEKVVADVESAREVVNTVLVLTQEKVKGFVEEVVSLALSVVYGDEYGFELEFGIKRNQSECTPWIIKGKDRLCPKTDVGGGVCDIASFALRMAIWALTTPKPANVFILDEPGRFLSQDKQPLFGQMVKEISELLGVQIILVSHSSSIIDCADKAYEVSQKKGISEVKEIVR